MAPPRKSERLARELALTKNAAIEEDHLNPYVLRRLCKLADEKMIRGDRDCLRIARLCCRIAARLKADSDLARSFGRLASALRLSHRLGHAEEALKYSLKLAPYDLRGDLLRRRCILRIYQNQLEKAQSDAESAVAASEGGAAWARALGALGIVLYYRKDYRGAITQLNKCVANTDPDAEEAYCRAIQNYATALAEGTEDEVREGLELCKEARKRLKPRHKMQRAKLWWTIGLLQLRLGKGVEAWRALDTARRSLIALQAAPEVAAIIADMARVSPKPLAIRQICYEAGKLITGRHPLTQPLRALARAATDVIPEAAVALREEAGRLTPCPAL